MTSSQSIFSNKLRVRVCGMLIENESILLNQIHSPITHSLIWLPPGGGLQFGETMHRCLQREFHEETNLQIEVGNLIHINELISSPFHALEFYFEVKKTGGEIELGTDPEMSDEKQLLKDLQWISFEDLDKIEFVPASLLEKIRDWENRSEFRVF